MTREHLLKLLMLVSWFAFNSYTASAQTPPDNRGRVQYEVLFPIGQGQLDLGYQNNWRNLNRFTDELIRILNNPNYVVSRIEVTGSASPDGALDRNLQLAQERANSLRNYLVAHCNVTPDKIRAISLGENWPALRQMIEASRMPYRNEMLNIMDRYPNDRNARKNAMQYYANSKAWYYMYEHFFPILRSGSGGGKDTSAHLKLDQQSIRNWERLQVFVMEFEMDNELKQALLANLNKEADPAKRLNMMRELLCGDTQYFLVRDFIMAGLLNNINSRMAEKNWERAAQMIQKSTLPNKAQVLGIIQTTPCNERENAIRAIDGGRTWYKISEPLFTELLLINEIETMTGSGVSFYYEPKVRQEFMEEQPSQKQTTTQVKTEPVVKKQAKEKRVFIPFIAIKTDLTKWAGLTPDFKISTYTPNLAVEGYFAQRWSIDLNGMYANWDYFSGDKLFAVSAITIEPRIWLRDDNTFKGLYFGVRGTIGEFDNQANKTAGSENRTGVFRSVGLSLGWLQPISSRWAFEINVSGNYRNSKTDHYDIQQDAEGKIRYYYNHQTVEDKFAPALRLNLMYRIGNSYKK